MVVVNAVVVMKMQSKKPVAEFGKIIKIGGKCMLVSTVVAETDVLTFNIVKNKLKVFGKNGIFKGKVYTVTLSCLCNSVKTAKSRFICIMGLCVSPRLHGKHPCKDRAPKGREVLV